MRGGCSVKWDIKLGCLLGRLCAVAVPYASCVTLQLLPLFVATAVVLLSCYIKSSRAAAGFFFLSFWIFLPSRCAKGPYGTAITSGPAGNSHSGSTLEQGCTSKKKRKAEGGRRWARLLPRTKSQRGAPLSSATACSLCMIRDGHIALCSSPRLAWQKDCSLRGPQCHGLAKGTTLGSLEGV